MTEGFGKASDAPAWVLLVDSKTDRCSPDASIPADASIPTDAMATSQRPSNCYRLGEWLVDESDGTIRGRDRSRRLEPRVMAVLSVLARAPGRVVGREEILAEVWADVHVHGIALTRCISELRKALGDDPRAPRYIETLPKRGYRLIAAVHPESPAAPGAGSRSVRHRDTRSSRGMRAAAAVVAMLTLVLGGSAGEWGHRRAEESGHAAFAWELYQRGAGFYARQRPQDNESARLLFREAVRRDPALGQARAGLADATAMKARYEGYPPDLVEEALALAQHASAAAPERPEGYKALGLALSTRGLLSRAAAAYSQALALRSDYREARSNLAAVLWQQGRLAPALAEAIDAAALGDADATLAANLAAMLDGLGFSARADGWFARALELDPTRVATLVELARRDVLDGETARARARLAALEGVVPDCLPCLETRADLELRAGRFARAVEAATAYLERRPDWRPAQLYAAAASLELDPTRAAAILDRAELQARAYLASGTESWWGPWSLGMIAALRGDRTVALRWLERAVAAGWLDWRQAQGHPLLASLHGDPGFEGLVARMRGRVARERDSVLALDLLGRAEVGPVPGSAVSGPAAP